MRKSTLQFNLEQADILELETIIEFFELKNLEKGDCFIEAGQLCRNVAFIEKGIVLYSHLDETGREVICDFAKETDWITHYDSFNKQKPSPMSIKAIEETQLQVISFKKIHQLIAEIPAFESYIRKVIEKLFISSLSRNTQLQVLRAEERYAKFVKDNPEIIQRVPQYHIASYLGIAPQSLSRIRKE